MLPKKFWSLIQLQAESRDAKIPSLEAQPFHLHPHYRAQLPITPLLLKVDASLDRFPAEKIHDQIALRIAGWSSSLLKSPQDLTAISDSLSTNFRGSSMDSASSRRVRSGPLVEVDRRAFSEQTLLPAEKFLPTLRDYLSAFSKVVTAEFQITNIRARTPAEANSAALDTWVTEVRYEIVGTGHSFYREQRTGHWELEWSLNARNEWSATNWRHLGEEVLSRSRSSIFEDVTQGAFKTNPSYQSQLQHGVDYWRAVLDGACGIDVYGHNGIAVGDFDGDGLDDLYICQPAGLPNRLFRNRGDGTFQDVTEKSGTGILENTACALFADINNNGQQDLVVVRSTGPLLLLNQGDGRFRAKENAFAFATPPQGTFTGAAIADYDRDGWLDIYFCLYLYYQGTEQYRYPSPYYDAQNGPPNFMMRNNRDGTFQDVTAKTGLDQNNTRYSFCCGWNDYNGDGWPDLYVVNDFGRKNLYRNKGNGTFTDIASSTGVEDVGAGMSVACFDFNNDGREDLYVANMWTAAGLRVSSEDVFQNNAPESLKAQYRKHAMGNSLLQNQGNDKFRDVSSSSEVRMGRWSWSSDAWDFDHDGFSDLYITNGMVSGTSQSDLNSFFWRQVVANSPAEARPAYEYEQGWNAVNELLRADGTWSGNERNVCFANNRDGTFSDVSAIVGLDFLEDGRAFALADFDRDGRLELFLKNRNAPQLRLLKNVAADLPPSISFRLSGIKSNRDAIGAVVTVETAVGKQSRTLQAGSGFLSQHTKEIFFGLGEAKTAIRASIRWPSGLAQSLGEVPVNHRIWVQEGVSPHRIEPYEKPISNGSGNLDSSDQHSEPIPTSFSSWLLAPVSAPDFSLPDISGTLHTLSELRGKAVFLSFWVTDSATCRENLIALNESSAQWNSSGLELISLNFDARSLGEAKLSKFLQASNIRCPVLLGSDDVAAIYNILYRYVYDRHRDISLPMSFLINAQGEIVKIYQGPIGTREVQQDFRNIPSTNEDRLAKALPFHGYAESTEFRRNYLSYGSVFFQLGYIDQAGASFRQALTDDPESAEALYGIGSVQLKQGQSAGAQESFEKATKATASYPETLPNAWNNLGLLATREGHMEDAVQYFQAALKVNPHHVIALVNLGNAYRQLRRWDDALKVLQQAVSISPEDSEASYGLGMVFAQLGDTTRAYELLRKAIDLRPVYPEALNNLGVLYLRTEHRDQAVATFEKCIAVAPDFDQAYLNLARVHALEKNPEKARAVLLDLLKRHPDHLQARRALAELQ